MSHETIAGLDFHDVAILSALIEDPRVPLVDLTRNVHLSRTAIARRIGKLRDREVFLSAGCSFAYNELGFDIDATVSISKCRAPVDETIDALLSLPEVLSVSTMTGTVRLSAQVIAADMRHLRLLISQIERYGEVSTKISIETIRSEIKLQDRLNALQTKVA